MGKGGGAGKVYFVLYLAVVLELLIIIVERDEAEEGLLKKQRETMKIVESILSQLQSGAGTEGINTRPQDEITIPEAGINIKELIGADVKSFRKYIVEVGVTDIAGELKKREGEPQKEYAERLDKLISLGNVEEIEYQIFFNSSSDPNNAPLFPSEQDIKAKGYEFSKMAPGQAIQAPDGSSWEFLSLRKLKLDSRKIMDKITDFNNINLTAVEPIYPRESELTIGAIYAPPDKQDSVFYYSNKETGTAINSTTSTLIRRSFVVNFQPPRRAGWFKLRFASRTNRILGVHSGVSPTNIPDEANINIGTVSLTAKDLKKVLKELTIKLERYNPPTFELLAVSGNLVEYEKKLLASLEKAKLDDNPNEAASKIRLYNYIVRLLAPGQSINFEQNKGSIEFNVRVILPEIRQAKPELVMPTFTATFDKLPAVFEFTASPWMGNNVLDGKVIDASNATVARIAFKPVDEINPAVPKPDMGKKRDYRATVDQALSPGRYTFIVTHRVSGQQREDQGELQVFPSRLTENSEKLINARMEVLYFGSSFPLMNPEPSSGGKIKPDQFRMYLSTDKNSQPVPMSGLSLTRDNTIFFDCAVKTATLKITWKQPYTDNEIDLYPANTKNVRQQTPTINTGDAQTSSELIGTNRLRVTIKNVRIAKPLDGSKGETAQAQISFDVDKKVNLSGMQGVELYSEPTIVQDGDGYKVVFELNVNLPKGVDMVKGTASVRVLARAKNNCNSELVSSQESKTINANISFEAPQTGRGGRSGGGGGGGTPRGGRK
jgi:hypothetical protein